MIRNSLILFSVLLCIAANAQTMEPALMPDAETRHDPDVAYSKFQNDINLTPDLTEKDTSKIGKNGTSILKNASTFNKARFYGVASITLAALAGSYIYMNNAWWAGQKSSFHFDGGTGLKNVFTFGRDVKYAKNLDKMGHFYGGRIGGDLFAEAVRWSGKSEKSSYIWGAVFSSSIQFFIEIKDGFSPDWGFSVYDFMAGTLGSFYPYFQSKSRFLKAVDYKFSYWRRDDYYFESIKRKSGFQDDYMNQTYWFTFNPKRFKPKSNWPKWLGISVGVGVDNKLNDYYTGIITDYSVLGKGGYEFFIAPDIDFTGLLPKTPFWQRAAKLMNYIKFPAPAIRLSNNSRFFAVYF
jgi:hypothetical protein